MVADAGGRLKSVVVTYGEVDRKRFIVVFPNGDAALEIAAPCTPSPTHLTRLWRRASELRDEKNHEYHFKTAPRRVGD